MSFVSQIPFPLSEWEDLKPFPNYEDTVFWTLWPLMHRDRV